MSLPLDAETYKERVGEWKSRVEKMEAAEVVQFASEELGDKIALATSLGAEDMVLLSIVKENAPACAVFTLDTGRLPQETYDLLSRVRKEMGVAVHLLFPHWEEVEQMVQTHGPNLFYQSIEQRKLCCKIRKIHPLRRFLASYTGWMTGLTRYQAPTRTQTPKVEWDEAFGLVKFNPLVDWSSDRIWAYLKDHNIPTNALHDKGYPSIGCAPCTRAIKEGEDLRAGRWWWESPEQKECGLHLKPKAE